MTSEEMERAIEILLNNQARYELQQEQTNQQLRETNEQTGALFKQTNEQIEQINSQVGALTNSVGIIAQMQREFMQVMLQYMQSQDKTNETFRDAIRDLSNALKRHITEDHGAKS